MAKEPKKKEDKSSDITVTIPVFSGLEVVFVELRIITDKKGRIKRTRMKWPNGDWLWTHYDKDGKPIVSTGGGKGWEMDMKYNYDKKGKLKSTVTRVKRGRVTTETTRRYNAKGKEIGEPSVRTFTDGIH